MEPLNEEFTMLGIERVPTTDEEVEQALRQYCNHEMQARSTIMLYRLYRGEGFRLNVLKAYEKVLLGMVDIIEKGHHE